MKNENTIKRVHPPSETALIDGRNDMNELHSGYFEGHLK